jgi:hypothetical protein
MIKIILMIIEIRLLQQCSQSQIIVINFVKEIIVI